ncbi:DUF6262 family protein [Actinoplanes derwentensis]|uniref:Replication region DNA-binding N-term n=1 Tax=Actinoplanes derwentensis TaxID=113562 RepID=A0A1H1WMW9_9ACTN|nr:DUF6262 family protein [Actinoplanes derwentensis]GID87471.1 hypothetical protein Ade03nite_63950 [Actinoplanes derwentensis]SDS97706.1 hypothetical protein SAMN04489716_2143 [Actinoplanes derwentensis]
MSDRTPAEVLLQARRRDSQAKRGKVLATLDDMFRRGDPVSFTAVAKRAGVSHWLVYADGVREHIDAARTQQDRKPHRDQQTGLAPSTASLNTDLELTRTDNSKLRAERDQLKAALRRRLGEQLNQLSNQSLVDRVDELAEHNQRLAAEADRLRTDNDTLRQRLAEAEEDLTGVRAALRRMMHHKNTADPAG